MKSQRRDTGESIWLKKWKKIGIDEVIKCNKFINNSLKSQIQNNDFFEVSKKQTTQKT